MGIRQKLKRLLRIHRRRHHDPHSPSQSRSPTHVVEDFYDHPNEPIQSESNHRARPYVRTRSANIQEPLEFTYKSYTTSSGVVIPPDFSYDHPKEVYRVSGLLPINDWDAYMEFNNNEVTDNREGVKIEVSHGEDEASAVSDYSSVALSRLTELALTAHETIDDNSFLRVISPRPLPQTPDDGGSDHPPARRRFRILTGRAMRRVRGIRIMVGGDRRSRIVRVISGGEESSDDERPRPARL